MIKVIYRISDIGYKKIKPDYINNENCLKNFTSVFIDHKIDIIADNVCEQTYDMITKYIDPSQIHRVNVGHGAGTFNIALDMAIKHDDNDIIYFVENDYLHCKNSDSLIEEGINMGFTYISLYDHPDKYLDPRIGGNKYCIGNAENTRVYLSQSCHWKLTNSTTMTFAAKVSTLKRNESILRKWTSSTHPYDFDMFTELLNNKEALATPIPGRATHGETAWLCPLIDWSKI